MTKPVDLDHFDQALLVADGDSTAEVDSKMLAALVAEARTLRDRLDAAERVADAARSVDVLLPSPSNIPTKTPELLASAIARLGMALDAYDAPDAALDAWRGGEGNE